MWTRFLYRSAGVDEKTGEMTYYAWAPRYDLSKPKKVTDANGNEVQQVDRWGEPVYEILKKKVTDANGKTEEVPVAMDRLTKTTVASEASYFLGKDPHPDLYGGLTLASLMLVSTSALTLVSNSVVTSSTRTMLT